MIEMHLRCHSKLTSNTRGQGSKWFIRQYGNYGENGYSGIGRVRQNQNQHNSRNKEN